MCKVVIDKKKFDRLLARKNYSARGLGRSLGNESRGIYLSHAARHGTAVSPKLRREVQRKLGVSFGDIFRVL